MESITNLHVSNLVNNLFYELTNLKINNSTNIKINCEKLSKNGEISFLTSNKVWKGYVTSEGNKLECKNILEQYLENQNKNLKNLTYDEVVQEAFKLIEAKSHEWSLQIISYTLQKERICLFLNRLQVLSLAIKNAVNSGFDYGRKVLGDEYFKLKIQTDNESEISNQRMIFLKEFSENILKLQGFNITNKECENNYILTTKSEGNVQENYKKIVCGVMLSPNMNAKEIVRKWDWYLNSKEDQLKKLNAHKYQNDVNGSVDGDEDIEDIAMAITKFEFLSSRPKRSLYLKLCYTENDHIMKGTTFILYNTARIKAILKKYEEMVLAGKYPKLLNIEDVDFSCLSQEEEWELIFNFVLQYPETIQSGAKHKPFFEPCPQNICSFLSRLCQQFSIYYRRSRILTDGYDHLMPTVMARIYLLRSLLVVLENALSVFGITTKMNM